MRNMHYERFYNELASNTNPLIQIISKPSLKIKKKLEWWFILLVITIIDQIDMHMYV